MPVRRQPTEKQIAAVRELHVLTAFDAESRDDLARCIAQAVLVADEEVREVDQYAR